MHGTGCRKRDERARTKTVESAENEETGCGRADGYPAECEDGGCGGTRRDHEDGVIDCVGDETGDDTAEDGAGVDGGQCPEGGVNRFTDDFVGVVLDEEEWDVETYVSEEPGCAPDVKGGVFKEGRVEEGSALFGEVADFDEDDADDVRGEGDEADDTDGPGESDLGF